MKADHIFNETNQGLIIRWGSIFVFCFFGIYVPQKMSSTAQHNLAVITAEYAQYKHNSESKIDEISSELTIMKSSNERKVFFQKETECLAKNIYFEAGSEPVEGKLAVAQVTMNRKREENYPKTVCGVVNQKKDGTCQFSWVCSPIKAISNKKSWFESKKIAENIVIRNKRYNVVGNATFFHADYVSPYWKDDKKYVAQIGRHIFYSN
ncbi:SleB Cell wall hydrolyses involved in spore germination [uncultured Caudovirales phage]|uniref:SleB Cell wall hydrolyses involved in spore germination n=1 Tax=uncultured Caudovirales phage TaxID=2100421 RepID=A0A6J5KVB9_9CAUD|nr:SleB Cell wall hydrolyses involved in spore germination [uncultured Caudovirales phage]